MSDALSGCPAFGPTRRLPSRRILATAMYLVESIDDVLARFRRFEPLGFSVPQDERTVINECRQILEDAELWPWPGYDTDGNPLPKPDQP